MDSIGLENVLKTLTAEAEAAAQKIVSEAEGAARSKIADAQSAAGADASAAAERAKSDAARIKGQGERAAEIESHLALLTARMEAIREAREFVLGRLARLPEPARVQMLRGMMERVIREMPGGTVVVRPEDAKLCGGVPGIKVRADGNQAGGILAESADGLTVLDFRLETLMDRVWEQSMPGITGKLFGG
jgi:vacuolar-type H+-ATPase subunit E/Vma4